MNKPTPRPKEPGKTPAAPADPANLSVQSSYQALQWIVEDGRDAAWAAADWLAHDIDPAFSSAVALLADPSVSLETLDLAKEAFKTLRVVGERSEDRRLGARLYLAAIAAALARHNTRITRQSDETLERSLRDMMEDGSMPDPLRGVAGMALCALHQTNGRIMMEPDDPQP